MKPNKRYIIYLVLLAVAVGIVWWITSMAFNDTPVREPFVSLESAFYYQPNLVYIPYVYVLGALVDCLEHYESGGNERAVGKAGEIGVLQFMPSTFQHFCVEQYNYRDDIWDAEIQRDCAAEMLANGLINHWTTAPKCL